MITITKITESRSKLQYNLKYSLICTSVITSIKQDLNTSDKYKTTIIQLTQINMRATSVAVCQKPHKPEKLLHYKYKNTAQTQEIITL